MDSLFLDNVVDKRLILSLDKRGIWSAIESFMGSETWETSLLPSFGFRASHVLRSNVISMNDKVMEVEVSTRLGPIHPQTYCYLSEVDLNVFANYLQ